MLIFVLNYIYRRFALNNINTGQQYFSKISNCVLYSTSEEDSILSKLDYELKAVSIFEYLYGNTGVGNGMCGFSLEDIIITCGYKPNPQIGRTNDIFKSILVKLQELNYISSDIDMKKLKPKQFGRCVLELDMNNKFISVQQHEKDKIYSVERIDNTHLFAYYCYLKGRVYKRSNDSNEAYVDGGRYENAFFSLDKVYEDLHITDSTVIKYNNILQELNLIRYKNFGTCYNSLDRNKAIKFVPNFYTLFRGSEEQASANLEQGFKMYKAMEFNKNMIFTGNSLIKDNRSLGGKLGALNKKEKNGKITDDEIVKKQEILEAMKDNFSEKYKMLELFKVMRKEITVSDYFIENDALSEKYYNIETSLGLIDPSTNDLNVDYDYYKWCMSNYDEKGFDYVKNCISKKLKGEI